jgi:hypothetical protein
MCSSTFGRAHAHRSTDTVEAVVEHVEGVRALPLFEPAIAEGAHAIAAEVQGRREQDETADAIRPLQRRLDGDERAEARADQRRRLDGLV